MPKDTFYQIRQELHQHPELSGHEAQTARFIENKLQAFNPTKIVRHVGGHGLLAEYFFSEDGPTVLFRADHGCRCRRGTERYSLSFTKPRRRPQMWP